MNTINGPVLVVEDASNVLEMIETVLKVKGYSVITARNGEEALEKINQERPTLIITDILMPKLDGYALAYRLHKDPDLRVIPLIFISATYAGQEDKDFAFSLGARHFIEKPIDTEDFLLTVAETLTQGTEQPRATMDEQAYQKVYRERLENKLYLKSTQIARTVRLLQALPDDQKSAFEALLAQEISDRDMIQLELDQLRQLMNRAETGQ